MLRDPLMSFPPDGSLDPYEETRTIEMFSFPEYQPNEIGDLSTIRDDDLLQLPSGGEVSQSLSQFIVVQEGAIENSNINQVLPDLEEHDKAGLKFELNLYSQLKGKPNWFYSKDLSKVYIKLNEIFNIDVIYRPRSSNEKIFIRTMMVFNSEVSEPVVRCENHSSKDLNVEKNIKHSVLRCENSNVIYQGTVEGKNISDRLSVRIPLGCVQPNEDDFVKQTVALKFVCQNSCVGRRETSIIFFLENAHGEILAKRVTNVKICSCPKRDMQKDENSLPKKRSRKDECPVGKKILKLDSEIKEEPKQEENDEEDSFSNVTEVNDIVDTPNGFRITMELPNMEAVVHVFDCAFSKVAGQMAIKPENAIMYSKVIKSLKKSLAKSRRVMQEQQK